MVLLDLLGRRWAMRVVWELRDEPLTFRALQARCDDASSSTLSLRLSELVGVGIARTSGEGYELTPAGRELLELFLPVNGWAERHLAPSPGA